MKKEELENDVNSSEKEDDIKDKKKQCVIVEEEIMDCYDKVYSNWSRPSRAFR